MHNNKIKVTITQTNILNLNLTNNLSQILPQYIPPPPFMFASCMGLLDPHIREELITDWLSLLRSTTYNTTLEIISFPLIFQIEMNFSDFPAYLDFF